MTDDGVMALADAGRARANGGVPDAFGDQFGGFQFWTRVGVAWKNPKAVDTVSLVLNEGVSVSGKVVLLPYVEQGASEDIPDED
jgi:hypothetical protein